MEALYDATIAVVADEDLRAERAGARGHAAVDERHARQLPQEEKAAGRPTLSSTTVRRRTSSAPCRMSLSGWADERHGAHKPPEPGARRTMRRRRIVAMVGVAALAVVAVAVVLPVFHHAVKEVVLPLRHEDIIRQQAREKGLDPALVAARHLHRVALPRPDVATRARRG